LLLTWTLALLLACASPSLGAPRGAQTTSAQDETAGWRLDVLPVPQFGRVPARATQRPARPPRLVQMSSAPNSITDEREWFERHNLSLPLYKLEDEPLGDAFFQAAPLPRFVPLGYRTKRLVMAIRQPRGLLAVYGDDYASGQYLVALDSSGRFRYGYDFGNYAYAPQPRPGERQFVYQKIEWAAEADGTLYVQHSHSTYARSSRGMNAYLTAIDTGTGRVLWRSAPLVANASNFEVVGDLIVSGYGFTNEPDYLFLLDRATGEPRQRLPVRSGPRYIIRKGERIFVRAYDADYVFRLASR
jgi:hypothetical protein